MKAKNFMFDSTTKKVHIVLIHEPIGILTKILPNREVEYLAEEQEAKEWKWNVKKHPKRKIHPKTIACLEMARKQYGQMLNIW